MMTTILRMRAVQRRELDFDAGFTTHTITFKCMGTTKDADHQVCAASCLLRECSDCNLTIQLMPMPLPLNVRSAMIGSILDMSLVEVHEAISERKIISVKISWIKHLLCWMKSVPGFYAGIDVSLRGSWSSKCTCVAMNVYKCAKEMSLCMK